MSTKKAYVIGDNAHKSLSPMIFNYWFKKYNIDGEYGYIQIEEKNFEKEIKEIINKKDFCGLNVTVPYKEKIIPYLSKISEDSKKIGAVNCITNFENSFLGDNTDWRGICDSLKWLQENKKPQPLHIKKGTAIVLGYGGAAKATIHALYQMGYETTKVFNRSFDKIKNIKQKHFHKTEAYELKDLKHHLENADLVINTIPSSIFTKELLGEKLYACYDKRNYGYNLVYNSESNFLDFFEPSFRIEGLWMLLFQAVPCFNMWFNAQPEIDDELIKLIFSKTHKK